MNLPSKVTICEVGLRDGLQNEARILQTSEKLDLANDIIDAGFKVIELGSFVSPKAVPQMVDTDQLFSSLNHIDGIEFRALIANKKGVERAINCGCRKVKLNVSASRQHNLANLNMTPEESVAGFEEIVNIATQNGIEVSGSISMPFGSPWEGNIPIEDVQSIVEAYLNVGITEISLSDASGMAVPNQVYSMCCIMQERYPQVKWWLHFHNTRGMAMANILAAMQAGITQFDSSFAGLGGCPFVPGATGTDGVKVYYMGSLANTGAIFVNNDGKRFINEQLSYNAGMDVVAQGGTGWMIFDQSMVDSIQDIREYYNLGLFESAPTIEELADKIGVNKENLVETVNRYVDFVKNGKDEDFGRPMLNLTFDEPPYYACKLTCHVQGTFGGIRTDTSGRVLNTENDVIPGLYAAGECASVGTYGANPMAVNIVFGRIAGESAAAYAQ